MNRHQKKFLGTAVAILNVAFSLSVGAIATYAWFQTNAAASIKTVDSEVTIQVKSPNIAVDYDLYKYDIISGEGYKVAEANKASEFKLPTYDGIFEDAANNTYADVIMRVSVDFGSFTPSSSELQVLFECDPNSEFDDALGEVLGDTSNISQFKCLVSKFDYYTTNSASVTTYYDSNILEDSTEDALYKDAHQKFVQKTTATTYVSINNDVYKKSSKELVITPYFPSTINSATIHITKAVFYIECSYNHSLVSKFMNSDSGKTLEQLRSRYSNIAGDIDTITFTTPASTNGTSNTGRYVKVLNDYSVESGKYLPIYRSSSANTNATAFNGSLIGDYRYGETGDPDSNSGNVSSIYAQNGTTNKQKDFNVDVVVNNSNNSIVSNPETDAAALTYLKNNLDESSSHLHTSGFRINNEGKYSYVSNNIYSIGNTTNGSSATIRTSKNINELTSNISIKPDATASISATSNASHSYLRYNDNSNDKRFAFQNESSNKAIEVFEYQENATSVGVIESINIKTEPKTIYDKSTETSLDIDGLVVEGRYTDGGRPTIRNSSLSFYFNSQSESSKIIIGEDNWDSSLTDGTYTIYVKYVENSVSYWDDYQVTISSGAVSITGITIDDDNATTDFFVGDSFTATGLNVIIHYSDNTEESAQLSDCSIFNGSVDYLNPVAHVFSQSDEGQITLTVTYNSIYEATYDINVYNYSLDFKSTNPTTAIEDSRFTLEINPSTLVKKSDQDVQFYIYSTTAEGAVTVYQDHNTASTPSITYNAVKPATVVICAYIGSQNNPIISDTWEIEILEHTETYEGSGDYNLVTLNNMNEFEEGNYIIVSGSDALKNTINSSRGAYEPVTIDNDKISETDSTIVWHIAKSGDYYTIYNAAAEMYSGSTGSKNQLALLADSSSDNAKWTIELGQNSTFNFINLARSSGTDSANKYLRKNGTYGFACYAEGTGTKINLYKKDTSEVIKHKTIPVFSESQGFVYCGSSETLTKEISYTFSDGFDTQSVNVSNVEIDNTSYASLIHNSAQKTITITPKPLSVPAAGATVNVTVSLSNNRSETYPLEIRKIYQGSITTPPTKTSYNVNQTFDPTGMVVTVKYNNNANNTAIFTYSSSNNGFGFDPALSTSLTTNHKSIAVTYCGVSMGSQTISVSQATGGTATFIPGNGISSTGLSGSGSSMTDKVGFITFSTDKGYRDDTRHVRVYSGGYIEFTSDAGYLITKVEFTSTASGTSNNGPSKISLASGYSGSYTYSSNKGTWTYSNGLSSVKFSANAQFRFTQVVVTYKVQ